MVCLSFGVRWCLVCVHVHDLLCVLFVRFVFVDVFVCFVWDVLCDVVWFVVVRVIVCFV